MTMRRDRAWAVAAVLGVGLLAGALGFAGRASGDAHAPAAAMDPTTRGLLEEKRGVLQQLVALRKEEYKRGQSTVVELEKANLALLEADLELAGTHEERLNVLEKSVAEAKRMEEHLRVMSDRGEFRRADMLNAVVARLDLQVRAQAEKNAKP